MHPLCQIATVLSAGLVKCECSSFGNRGRDGVLTQSSSLPWKNTGHIGKLGKLLLEGIDTIYVSKDFKKINETNQFAAPPWISSIKSIFERWVRLTSVTVPVLSQSCLPKIPKLARFDWQSVYPSATTSVSSSKLGSLHLLNDMPLLELLFSCAWCDPWLSMVIFRQGLGNSPRHDKAPVWFEHFGPPPLHMSPRSWVGHTGGFKSTKQTSWTLINTNGIKRLCCK